MPNANDQVQEIFHAALEIASVDKRIDFLDQACSQHPSLRAEVDRLLRSHIKATEFMEQRPTLPRSTSGENSDEAVTQAPIPTDRSSFQTDEQLPRYFGDYELLEKIAQGGMGVVFKARQASLNRIVAIKMILSGQFAGQDEIERFYIEAEAAGKLDHAGIVPVFDVGCNLGQHYFSMAFVEGQSLSAKIKEGPLPPREAATLAKKIAVAVQFAHHNGIVHRDLKPGNVLLDNHDDPRITDFGLAKRVEGNSHLTATGMVLGTPSYMPPEQAAGKAIDAAADVYSLGAILYAMLTGRPPFDGDSQLETILQVLQDEPIALRQLDKQIPQDLEAICLKCLEKNPVDRYLTAADLASDLQSFLSCEPIRAKNNFRRRIRKWTVREPVLAAHLAATLVLALLVFFNWLQFGDALESDNFSQHWNNYLEGPKGDDIIELGINMICISGLALVVLALQKIHNIFPTASAIPYLWASANPIFLTTALIFNQPPRGPLLSIYFLPIVTSCFFRRYELVATTTIVSLIGFVVLLQQEFKPVEYTPAYHIVFGVNMAVSGGLLSVLALRMKRLGEQHSP